MFITVHVCTYIHNAFAKVLFKKFAAWAFFSLTWSWSHLHKNKANESTRNPVFAKKKFR